MRPRRQDAWNRLQRQLLARPESGVHLLFVGDGPDDVVPTSPYVAIAPAEHLGLASLRQPDAQRMQTLLTRHPRRHAGDLVFLADMTAELDERQLGWAEIGVDWAGVIEGLRQGDELGHVEMLKLHGFGQRAQALVTNGPNTVMNFITPSGIETARPGEREAIRSQVRSDLEVSIFRDGPLAGPPPRRSSDIDFGIGGR